MITSEQIKAARAILRWKAKDLSEKSGVSLATIQRMEQLDGAENTLMKNVIAVQKTLENAGVEFIPSNGGGVGVRLRNPD